MEWTSNGKRSTHFPSWDVETGESGRFEIYIGAHWFGLDGEDVEHVQAFARALLAATGAGGDSGKTPCRSTHGGWRCNVLTHPADPHVWHAAVVEGIVAARWRD